MTSSRNIKIFTGNANSALADEVVDILGLPLGKIEVGRFSDGEISVSAAETVRGCDVFLIQSTNAPVNDNLMELLIMIDAMRRASAGRINAVIPYFGYARQDRKTRARDPITARLVANLVTAAGADRVVTMDLHAAQIQGFFDIPVDHLLAMPLLANHYIRRNFTGEDLCIISPDLGSVTRVRNFASKLSCPLAIIDKRRQRANTSEVMNLIGDVKGKKCILFDDMVDTAGTLVKAADALMKNGAKDVYACCTHAVLSGPAIKRLEESVIKELVVTNTIAMPMEKKNTKTRMISIAPVFAEAIERIYNNLPVSSLFQEVPTSIKPLIIQERLQDIE